MGMVLLISPLPKKALLRSVGSNSHFQNLQARTLSWSLGPSPVHGSSCPCSAQGMWLLLFQLQVQPLAKLHTHPRAGRAGRTGCHRQGAAFNTFPENTPDSQVPSSPSAGADRRSLVRAHTPSWSPKCQQSPSAMSTPRHSCSGGHPGSEPPPQLWAPSSCHTGGTRPPCTLRGWHTDTTGSRGGHHRPMELTPPYGSSCSKSIHTAPQQLAPGLCSTPTQGFYSKSLRHDLMSRSDRLTSLRFGQYWPALFTSEQHLFNPFLSISTFPLWLPSPAHFPTSVGRTNNPLKHPGPSGLQPYQF